MQSLTQQATNTFVKGLITEAGPLTFPENASVAESNCDLRRDGTRRRRLGIEYEAGSVMSTEAYPNEGVTIVKDWDNVGGCPSVSFSIVQRGNKVLFYEKTSGSFSAARIKKSFTSTEDYELNLSEYNRVGGLGSSNATIETAVVNGALVVVSPEIEPLLVTRDPDTGEFSVEVINFRVRDFEWQGSISNYFVPFLTPSSKRIYDTYNTSWSLPEGETAEPEQFGNPLAQYRWYTEEKWPPLTHPWFSGKTSLNVFSVEDFKGVYAGNSLAANGHYILNLFEKNRQEVSGIISPSLDEKEDSRFSCVAPYSGRVFYSGLSGKGSNNASRIFFSQLLVEGYAGIGDCFQVNDPTSEYNPDLLDTDGGFIEIKEAYNIQKLHVFGAQLLVFAENGVWSISGVDDVFRATEYSVNKISEVGLSYKDSFVSANGRPYWWSNLGVHTLDVSAEYKALQEQNISISTIQTFWEEIGETERSFVQGIYDGINRTILWMFPSNGETVVGKFNEFLLFDEILSAFYPWTIEDGDGDYIAGATFFDGEGSNTVAYELVDSEFNLVTDSLGNQVVVTQSAKDYSSSRIKFLTITPESKLTFSEFTSVSFLDWGITSYESYAETGYNFMGDLTVKKNAPYVTVYLGVTETGWVGDETSGYQMVRPSSCGVDHIWDFSTSGTTRQEAYRLKRVPVVDPTNLSTFEYPEEVVVTRLKLRGRGRSARLRFSSSEGKDFHLLGWEVIAGRNPRV